MPETEYSFELSDKAMYWVTKKLRPINRKGPNADEKILALAYTEMKQKDPGFLFLRDEQASRDPNLNAGTSFWPLSFATTYIGVRSQLDIEHPSLTIQPEDVTTYLQDLQESLEFPNLGTVDQDLREMLANPSQYIHLDWLHEKFDRFGPKFIDYLSTNFVALDRFISMTPRLAHLQSTLASELMAGILDVSIPIIQKIEREHLAQTFPQ